MKRHLVVFLMGVALVLSLHAQQNYVRTFTPLVEVAPGTPLNEENSRVVTHYYDRAGRKVQTVLHRASPDGKDMADLTMYDGLGRVARRWASLPIGGTDGAYVHPDVFGTCAYRGNYHIDYDYEPSSLSRLVKETNRNTRGHAITTDYLYTDKVPEFEMVNETTIRNVGTGRRTCKGVKVTDENGASRIEYTDLWGRLMMTERIGFFGDTLRTCYVYDRFDNLCCVLPPMAMEGLNEKGEYILFRDLPLRDYSYFYCYDKNGYCKAKKLPGALWTYIVNDRGGRPILVQQPMQAHKREWSFTFYDTNGRVAISGILKTSLSHKELMKWMENRLLPVSRDASVDCGYSIPGFDISYSSFKVTQAYYYDRYEFLSTSSLFKRKFSRADTLNCYASNGFLTGKYTAMLDNGGGYELSLFNYDHRGRMIRKAAINTVSGLTTRELYTYDFCNNLISKRVAFNDLGCIYITMHSYQYDREGRETSAELELSRIGVDLKEETVSIPLHSTSYDSFGRPLNKTIFNNLDTETFTYRSDGKLQKYGGKDFRQTLRYDDDINLFGYTSYNGSITAWNIEQGNQAYEFHMQYDGFNRLNGIASMRIPGGLKGGMSYDKNGNITSKYVGTSQKDINYLEFVYSGNHIKSIRDIKLGREPASGYGDIFYEAYESNKYSYDANGNEVANNAHNVARAHYNELNLPDTVHFLDGNMLYMRYLADGRRIQTITKTYNTIMSDPTDNVHADGDPYTLTEETHDGNVVLKNGVIRKIELEGGYANILPSQKEWFQLNYYVKDYLGNIRAVCNGKNGEVLQSMEYTPTGLIFRRRNYEYQSKRYCGKEELTMHGYNMYDSGARFQYSLIPRFNTMDPLCEKYYDVSPYAYCNGDPVNLVDPDGKRIIFINGFLLNDMKAGFEYWNESFVKGAQDYFYDNGVTFFTNVNYGALSSAKERENNGYNWAKRNYYTLIVGLKKGEVFNLVSHSMGGAFSIGIEKLLKERGHIVSNNFMINTFQVNQINIEKDDGTFHTDYRNTDDPVIKLDLGLSSDKVNNAELIIRENSGFSDFRYKHAAPISRGADFWKHLKKINLEKFIDSPIRNHLLIPNHSATMRC